MPFCFAAIASLYSRSGVCKDVVFLPGSMKALYNRGLNPGLKKISLGEVSVDTARNPVKNISPTAGARFGFKHGAFLIALITVSAASLLIVFGVQSVQRIQSVEAHWIDYNHDAAEAGRRLHEISLQMGYGGFIHNFKNYLLRQDFDYAITAGNKSAAINADLDRLESLTISDEEKAGIKVIRNVVAQYTTAIELAAEAFKNGMPITEIDSMLRIDDGPALDAISKLNRSIMDRTQLAESEIGIGIRSATSMIWILLAFIPVIVVLGWVLILFLRRIMEAHANLAEVRDELAMLLQQAPDAILNVDQNGAVLRANDRALTLFGYTRDELLNKQIEDIIPGSYSKSHTGLIANAFDALLPQPLGDEVTFYALTKDGREVPVEVSLNFSYSGGERIATAIVRDVTERKRVEQVLKQVHYQLEQRVLERTAELKQRTIELEAEISERHRAENQVVQSSKMATIGEMASGITHELNQPMNIMRMGVEAAQIRIQRGQADIPSISETLERIEGQIARMSDIINHMRVYSRQDTEGRVPFDPYLAVEEGCKLFSGQLVGMNVDLVTDFPSSENAKGRVLGHSIRMEQVILNLLSNARDAVLDRQAREGANFTGRILVQMCDAPQSDVVLITVEDNGGGVSEESLPHIFAPFVTTKESGKGTGLGLSISYGIVEGMGGLISATNIEEGARFEMSLPQTDEEISTHISSSGVPPQSQEVLAQAAPMVETDRGARIELAQAKDNAIKVLVVDDEHHAAHSLADYLQELGYLVYTAYNGAEAMQIYESDPVDVVITDLQMPVMGGETLVRKLRALSASLPIFVMTGQGGYGDRVSSGGLDVTDIWRKPVSLSEIAQRLQDVFGAEN